MVEGNVVSPEAKLKFDDDTLRAIADVYREEGNKEYKRKELKNAVYFYTEGIQVNCKDIQLNAKLYSNRATAHFYLGNYCETLYDATVAVMLDPTYIKPIERGASACEKLQRYKDAIAWCDKGLAIDKTSKTLVDVRTRCVAGANKCQETKPQKLRSMSATHPGEGRQSEADLAKPAKNVGDNVEVKTSYGNAHDVLGDLNRAINYLGLQEPKKDPKETINCLEIWLKITKQVGDKADEGEVYSNLGNVYENVGDFKTAVEYHKWHLKIAKELGDKAGEGEAYRNLGNAYKNLGDFKTAVEYHKRDLTIANEVRDKAGEGEAYSNLGIAYQSLGNFKTAVKYHKRHLKIARELGDKSGEGRAYGNIGVALLSLGNFGEAMACHERRLQIAKEVGDKAGEGRAYSNLGIVYQRLGKFETAINYHTRHLQIAKQVEDKAEEGKAFGNLGIAHQSLGNVDSAIHNYEIHLKSAKEFGDKAGEGIAYSNFGGAYQMLGDFKGAIDYHERHLKIAKESGDKSGQGIAYGNLGNAYQKLGDFKRAIDYYERHLKIAKEMAAKAEEGRAYGSLGIAYQSLGDFIKAIDYCERCQKIAIEVGERALEGGAYCNLGNAYHSLGDFKTAIDYHERHLKIAKEVGDKAGEGMAYGNLGYASLSLGEIKPAIDYNERSLNFAKEVGDKDEEGRALGNLGNAYYSLGDFKTAIDFHKRHLNIAKEVGNKAVEGTIHGSLGSAYHSLGDFKTAIDYHEDHLKIAKEVGDKGGEGIAYCNIGIAYQRLGLFKTAFDYHLRDLNICKEVGDKAGTGNTYSNLGNVCESQGGFKTAIDFYKCSLKIAKEVGDKVVEGRMYGNLGNAYHRFGNFKTAIEHLVCCLKIAIEVEDRAGEGKVYGYLGNAFQSANDFIKAIDNYECSLKINQEVGNKAEVALLFYCLGRSFESQGYLLKALHCYHSSVSVFNNVRHQLKCKDEWKISYRDMNESAYHSLWSLLLKQGKVVEALFAAEQGRAQALNDLMVWNYGFKTTYYQSHTPEESAYDSFSFPPTAAVFLAIDERDIVFWVVQNGQDVQLRRKELSDSNSLDLNNFFQSLIVTAFQEIGVRAGLKCENRKLDNLANEKVANERSPQTQSRPVSPQTNSLRTLYDVIFGPISDLVHSDELILVPDGPLCLAPFAAFMDPNSRYLCEFCRIRTIPSLTSLKLITDCPNDYHSETGVLLVGDPWVQEVVCQGLEKLPYAREEVEMIGRILNTKPLTGKGATKDEVLRRLPSVALVHIAAHGRMETGEIALAPNTTRASQSPVEEDFLLTMKDVTSVQIQARLVVLSCCHSARGEIKAEGVVGIARAFLGAGARSVLVSLWAIDDEATLEFMKGFYSHLAIGRSASESLNQAMKCMRESDKFSEVKHWAPFVLIGDDVTLAFGEGE